MLRSNIDAKVELNETLPNGLDFDLRLRADISQ